MPTFNVVPALRKPASCHGCALENASNGFSRPEGPGANRVLILGEALDQHGAKDGLPFRPGAPAGSVLERAFRACGYDRQSFALFNLVACQPFKNELSGQPFEMAALDHCRRHLKQVIATFKPKVIFALGGVALRSLTGLSGKKLSIEHLRGYVLDVPEFPDITCVFSYHPSYIVRGASNVFPALCRDLRYAVQLARDGFHPEKVNYVEQAGMYELAYIKEQCTADEQLVVSVDFETDGGGNQFEDEQLNAALEELYGEPKAKKKTKKRRERLGTDQQITQVNISIKEAESFVFQRTPELMEGVNDLLMLPNPKIGHNCFARNTSVLTPRGWKPIHTLFVGDKITSLNQNGEICTSLVKKTFKNRNTKGWLEVRVDGAYNRGVGKWGNSGVVCTPDHVWFSGDGERVAAQDLVVGDNVLLPRPGNFDLIAGTLLGDAHAMRKRNALTVSHTDKEWAAIKAKAFNVELKQQTVKDGYKLGNVAWSATTPIPGYWRDRHYTEDGGRIWNEPNMRQLSVWYADDGCFAKEGRNGKKGNATISLHKYPLQKYEIKRWFESRFGKCSFHNDLVLYLHLETSIRFFAAIADYVHPSMYRKLPDCYRGRYDGWLDKLVPQVGRVLEVRESNGSEYEFCIEVTKTHCFFTRGGLVSNCFAFDMPVAAFNGLTWNGITDDTMLCMHHLFPDLPGRRGKMDGELDGSFANLQYCASFASFPWAWKHQAQEKPEFYGCCDSDAALRLFNWVKAQMQSVRYGTDGPTVWDSYVTLVADLWPILAGASRRGIPVNKTKILAFLDSVVKRQRIVGQQIQSVIPSELLQFKPYKKRPKVTDGMVLREYTIDAKTGRCKCFRVRTKDVMKWMDVDGAEVSQKDGKLRAPNPECEVCGGTGVCSSEEHVKSLWCKPLPFNPNSPIQMKAYATHLNHVIPLNKEKKRAMDKWTLDQLARKYRDPLYRNVIEYRQFEKMSAYAVGWMPYPADLAKGWEYDAAHPEFSFFPATGQLSSFGPNAQNVMSLSKYGELAYEFRDGVEAPPGYTIAEFDLKSFHAQTLGFEAGSMDYIRLAKLDVHSFVAGNMLKLPHFEECLEWEDAALLDFLKWHRKNYTCPDGTPFQKVRDERAKVGVLAFGLGQGPNALFEANRDNFLPDDILKALHDGRALTDKEIRRGDRYGLQQATLVQETLNARFPELQHYRENHPLVVKKQGGKDISRYGCVRWFWDILHWDSRRGMMVHGNDFEKCIAFPVQNDGHGYLKYALLRLNQPLEHDERGALVRFGFINTVHDSVVFCCKNELVSEMLYYVPLELQRPSEVLLFADGTGLDVGCECKLGPSWGNLKEVAI